ncbi:Uncharacterised protein [Mycobacterium tuberculosis]|nr:Uncharacterised protein [Mycobacterium tuberculosis]
MLACTSNNRPSATRWAWSSRLPVLGLTIRPFSSVAIGSLLWSRLAATTSSSQLEKNTDDPGSPWRPARPRSWLSSRSVW